MSSEILVNITPTESRVALVENGVLQEVAIERNQRRGLVGNLYKGKVVRVLPGMQAAFVDLGLEKAGFIHVDDVERAGATGDHSGGAQARSIGQLLREGQDIAVQILKDPIGTKGARLSMQLSVSSRYLVYMPGVEHIGVSQRIDNEEERERLRDAVRSIAQSDYGDTQDGYIIRTAAEGVAEEELRMDIGFLNRLWQHVREKLGGAPGPRCVYEDLPLPLRTLRDRARDGIEKIRVDSRQTYQQMCKFSDCFHPETTPLIEYYEGERPLFYLYGVEDELSRALERKVPLKSGGYLVIDQTEAMATVDVNTGGFVGHRNLEETIFKTNLEAAGAIARQLRLRNLGGIIILDFIDMKDPEHRRQVLRALEKVLAKDRAKTSICAVSELGLVEMTRKRTSENLQQLLCDPCGACHGRGYLKSAETVSYEILREIHRESRVYECQRLVVLASQVVIDRLLDEDSANVADLEECIARPIEFRSEAHYSQEQYDIIPV